MADDKIEETEEIEYTDPWLKIDEFAVNVGIDILESVVFLSSYDNMESVADVFPSDPLVTLWNNVQGIKELGGLEEFDADHERSNRMCSLIHQAASARNLGIPFPALNVSARAIRFEPLSKLLIQELGKCEDHTSKEYDIEHTESLLSVLESVETLPVDFRVTVRCMKPIFDWVQQVKLNG